MTSPRVRRLLPYFIIAAAWLITRLWLVPNAGFWAQWELWEARKLLEYGFRARQGALMAMPFMAGLMPFPTDLNYTNHPYSMVWFLTALYAMGGWKLCVGFLLALKLAGTLAFYTLLQRFFQARAATWATLLFVLAPAALSMDVATNIITIAASFWPFAALLAMAVGEGRVRARWLGLLVFGGVQTSWFFVTFGPGLMWLAAPAEARGLDFVRDMFRWPGARAVLIGGFLASVLFFVQFAHYVPDAGLAFAYLRQQAAASATSPSRLHLLAVVLARHFFFIGPALGIAALFGLRRLPLEDGARRLVQAGILFAAGFLVVEIALLQFCFSETSPYFYLLYPATVLSAATLQRSSSRVREAGLVICAVAAAAYVFIRDTVPLTPAAPSALAPLLARHTRSDEIILSNLRPQNPPFASWDASGPAMITVLADRVTWLGGNDRTAIASVANLAKRNFQRTVFVYCPEQPLSAEVQAAVQTHGTLIAEELFTPPAQPRPAAATLRVFIWKFTGRFANRAPEDNVAPTPVHLQFYRMAEGWAQFTDGE